uniref:Uncharacterized protein n=1 Tax=Panagrolaimus sp. ES5 TaxID=591445 RepID=A0AC34F865_9BILA
MFLFNFFLGLYFLTLFGGFARPRGEHQAGYAYETIDGIKFSYEVHDDLILYTTPGYFRFFTNFCKFIDPATMECYAGDKIQWTTVINAWPNEAFEDLKIWFCKVDVIVINPMQTLWYVIDILTYGFPTYSLYRNNHPHLKVEIYIGDADFTSITHGYHILIEDKEDKCRQHRPTVFTYLNMFNLNLFVNRKWTKYAYYFIKNDKYICSYAFDYHDLFQGKSQFNKSQVIPLNFSIIDNYPTENYAPTFFAVDALYGTFVSLYWDQYNLPEAHFYIINENDLKNIQLIDRYVLNDFDQDVLKDIFNQNIDSQYFPTFSSYGRQIFVWFKRPSENRAFQGLWKNETEYDVHYQDLSIDIDRKIWKAKKEYIQMDRPVGRQSAPSTPPPVTLPPAPPRQSTTPMLTTTLPPTSESTTQPPTSTSPPTTTVDSNSTSATDDGSSAFTPISAAQNQLPNCTDKIYNNLWFLILLICIIIIEIIILTAAKKSIKEKSLTTSGGKTTGEDAKKTTTVDQTTNYYTVNETFNKSAKKKLKK